MNAPSKKTTPIKVLIVEDSRLARADLKALLVQHSNIEIVAEATNCDEAIELIENHFPDLIFLDINLPDGNGFDILQKINLVPEIIFTTAYDEYAIEAFEVNALDYLLKPVRAEKLERALEKLERILSAQKISQKENHAIALKKRNKVFVKDGKRCWLIEIGQIRYFQSAGNYSQVFFDKNKPMIYKPLSKIEQRLPPNVFFRANRQQIVNLDFIDSVESWGNSGLLLIMSDGKEIEVSRRLTSNFKQLLSF